MLVEIRIYRRHDADLMMLKAYDVNISKMMRLALDNYVSGERIKFRLPDSRPCDISKTTMLRYRLNIKNPKVIKLLKGIKQGYRNQFCKALLRDMLDTFALGVFFENSEDIEFENNRIASDAMVAEGVSLGLITKRNQITTDTLFKNRKEASENVVKTAVERAETEERRIKEDLLKSGDSIDKMALEAEKKIKESAPPPSSEKDYFAGSMFDELFEDEETEEEKTVREKARTNSLMSMFTDMMAE